MCHVILKEEVIIDVSNIKEINGVSIHEQPRMIGVLVRLGLIERVLKADLMLTEDVNIQKGIFYTLQLKFHFYEGHIIFLQGFEYRGDTLESMKDFFQKELEVLREGRIFLSLRISPKIEKYGFQILSKKKN
ncbi:hypothetical protein A2331_05185 [Candidatus Falkowbacteria bacterium RIFOXYB2_FULL_34_18]|uniref:Uncharacterized protein n=1 Tax=Candidatus Falkowbacteria bacterium RIFOXYD2_FULL_34_120 TaxID=1798007 RepID=A0A1F5TN16_9BACT|nr:MAG: hypothetical protein A2500_07060 [Candidatus Falkowbacteria bacterium RIFOXYC12_FULL_34_55]OGF28737.1 MAG: hypothetical protein A2331_05185 [Candidatus Falkowbacteria bacterium RIFOXYB2_FULL_34_18]OGF38102.1 MAG: hypothetical protein A2466_04365 [Candidatus Falkowbacteria bacterium RIFOXYC2_FULL_34_220]OGF38356.1 MAG: hypothetical protein A2515_06395 [Candidatus Falkowbacteria bacterium RIFOXYD12_FULL_34_57]OGF40343.1 MAG: hypothetical protein A2531_00655 [Candidatus Falkowbacteria bact